MKSILISIFCLFFALLSSNAQNALPPNGGGPYLFPKNTCLTHEERNTIEAYLEENIKMLTHEGKLPQTYDRSVVNFDWPLQAAGGLNYNSYYGINYVDQDENGGLEDYNCGARTYNGHNGTDIFTWPFPWNMVTNNLVDVIAGAAGTIIGKFDGNDDDHCACSGNWNAVYVQHSDGSIAWYGHLKKNSVTSKNIGETVAVGEYLGVVASSGCSTGPHLHFEVYKQQPYQRSNLIDPYTGSCNGQNSQSWWNAQKPYREPTINTALTHSAPPSHGCPANNEVPNFSNAFAVGTTGYFAAYYHDQTINHVSTLTIRKPDNSIWQTWSHTSPATYDASWWWWSWTLPSNGPNGTWKWEVTYQGTTVTHNFSVTGAAPVELTYFSAQKAGNQKVKLEWATEMERNHQYFELERSHDGILFSSIGKVAAKGPGNYQFMDLKPDKGDNYYRLKQVAVDGDIQYSDVEKVGFQRDVFRLSPNPTPGSLVLHGPVEQIESIRIFDVSGRLMSFISHNSQSPGHLDISVLPKGLYCLEITYENQVERLKVFKE
jgi:hypothetical protein